MVIEDGSDVAQQPYSRCELQLVRNCGTIVVACRDKITCPPCRDSVQKISRASVAFTLLLKKHFRLRDPIVDRRGARLQRFDWMG
jgi:hypothetical protein